MTEAALLLYIIKLALGGVAAVLAILLWGKTRYAAWLCLMAGLVVGYAGIVYSLLVDFGTALPNLPGVFGIPLSTLLFSAVPPLFFILALILLLYRAHKTINTMLL